jgi:hypothetical protein
VCPLHKTQLAFVDSPWAPNTQLHSNTPAVETLATVDVDELGSRRDMQNTNVYDNNALANEVEVNLNILGALMLVGFDGEVDGTDVVIVYQSGLR